MSPENFDPEKKISLKSRRLLFSPVSLDDLEIIHELHALPETDEFNTLGIPENMEETKAVIAEWIHNTNKNKGYTFKIELSGSKDFIGLISLILGKPKFKSAEVWYKLHPDFWNQGYATEALNKILDFGFDQLKLHRIEAGCAIDNIGSIRVLEKVGMIREGRKRKVLPLKTGWSDNFHYAILSTDIKH